MFVLFLHDFAHRDYVRISCIMTSNVLKETFKGNTFTRNENMNNNIIHGRYLLIYLMILKHHLPHSDLF